MTCAECSGPLVSPEAVRDSLCGACLRRLGAVPVRNPDGSHDRFRCRCQPCVDRREDQRAEWAFAGEDSE